MPENNLDHNEDLVLRPMQASDLNAVLSIERVVFEAPWTRQIFEDELLINERTSCRVACLSGEIVGYYSAWHLVGESALNNLAVAPAYRRQGIGARLLSDFLQASFSKGAEECFLEVAVNNEAALHLYRKFGFAVLSIRKNYYASLGLDAYIMRKKKEES